MVCPGALVAARGSDWEGMDPLVMLAVMAAAFVTALLSAVAGFGGATLLLPVFIAGFGIRNAIPILTVAQLVSNGSRVWFNRADIVPPVVGWFALGAVPCAVAGGIVFATAPLSGLTRLLGVFLLVLVAWRRLRPVPARLRQRSFTAVGATSGFASALLGSVGPLTAPFFLAYGLVKGAFIGTEALAAVVMHVTKLVVYGGAALLTIQTLASGVALAPATVAGAWAGKRVLDHLPERVFVVLVEVGLVIAGLLFLVRG
jgi:uncharacterized membrane protein YfcA